METEKIEETQIVEQEITTTGEETQNNEEELTTIGADTLEGEGSDIATQEVIAPNPVQEKDNSLLTYSLLGAIIVLIIVIAFLIAKLSKTNNQ